LKKVALILTVYEKDKPNEFYESITSILDQSFKSFDILVQEDGPVDQEIHDLLIKLKNENSIKFLGTRKINKGFDYSLNELINFSLKEGYQYIARMDADDIAIKDRLEKQYHFMENHPQIDVVGMQIIEFGDDLNYSKKVTYPVNHNQMLKFFKKRVPIAHVTAFFRSTFFKKAGLYETTGHLNNGDTIIWMKGFSSGCLFANIDEVGVNVRVSNDFFKRRGGAKKTFSDFKNRLLVIRQLRFGVIAYFYALGSALVNLSPSSIKKFAYQFLRE